MEPTEKTVDGEKKMTTKDKDTEKTQKQDDVEPVEVAKTKGHTLDIGPPTLSGELACGHLDLDGKLHSEFTVTEMTGVEEDLLAGRGPVVQRLNQVIANCTINIGSLTEKKDIVKAVMSLTAADRIVMLITLRRISLGDFYDIKIQCPKCDVMQNFALNLSELEIEKMIDPRTRRYEHTLSTKKTVRWHIMTTEDEEWLTKKRRKGVDILTMTMLARLDEIDDEPVGRDDNERVAVKKLQGLRMKERNEIRALFDKYEGDVDTKCEFTCEACSYNWESDMDVAQPGFFFPSGM